jgi:hypothetical protein
MKRSNRRAFPFVQQVVPFGSPIDHNAAPLGCENNQSPIWREHHGVKEPIPRVAIGFA